MSNRPLLLDLTHTSHTRARTGIQRVVRALHRDSVTRPRRSRTIRISASGAPSSRGKLANLSAPDAGAARGAHWPWTARWHGRWRRFNTRPGEAALRGDYRGFLTAEVFSPAVSANLPNVFPRVAVFHDAIALRFPEISPSGTVARFPGYLQELLKFDGIAAVSEESRDSLLSYWQWVGVTNPPPVRTISLGVDPLPASAISPVASPSGLPVVLSVGTLEGRKNHLALLDACELLWARGEKFELRIIGSVHRQTGCAAQARLQALQVAGRPLRYDGPLGDEAVDAAYAACTFTVYPSLAEGFGLPVIESLARGRPCVCSATGALGELSRGGGCLALPGMDAASLAAAIGQLLASPAELAALSAAAQARTFKPWSAFAAEVSAWMQDLPRHG